MGEDSAMYRKIEFLTSFKLQPKRCLVDKLRREALKKGKTTSSLDATESPRKTCRKFDEVVEPQNAELEKTGGGGDRDVTEVFIHPSNGQLSETLSENTKAKRSKKSPKYSRVMPSFVQTGREETQAEESYSASSLILRKSTKSGKTRDKGKPKVRTRKSEGKRVSLDKMEVTENETESECSSSTIKDVQNASTCNSTDNGGPIQNASVDHSDESDVVSQIQIKQSRNRRDVTFKQARMPEKSPSQSAKAAPFPYFEAATPRVLMFTPTLSNYTFHGKSNAGQTQSLIYFQNGAGGLQTQGIQPILPKNDSQASTQKENPPCISNHSLIISGSGTNGSSPSTVATNASNSNAFPHFLTQYRPEPPSLTRLHATATLTSSALSPSKQGLVSEDSQPKANISVSELKNLVFMTSFDKQLNEIKALKEAHKNSPNKQTDREVNDLAAIRNTNCQDTVKKTQEAFTKSSPLDRVRDVLRTLRRMGHCRCCKFHEYFPDKNSEEAEQFDSLLDKLQSFLDNVRKNKNTASNSF